MGMNGMNSSGSPMQGGNMSGSSTPEFSAHELIVMNEALMTKSANADVLSHFAQEVQDSQLRRILEEQARNASNHYLQGVQILQGRGHTTFNRQSYTGQINGEPKLGLRQPSMPAPNPNGQSLTDRSISGVVLNLHKHGAVAWMTFALECADTELRSFLVNGALMCDQAAYDTFMYMNQRGYYQVPTLMQKTTDTMIHSYQASPGVMMQSGIGGQMGYNSMSRISATNNINPNDSNQINHLGPQ
ncbi:spore coat protein [Alicyclobacillus sp. ALC3]|uniref:spore coat protein n=1 Tax=Alicyclobacillus sp. ALC3 TaxID=2796143 RepID=UPI002378EECF|nr:spore coat protein [Alicyclobacillus sp. ALC3]